MTPDGIKILDGFFDNWNFNFSQPLVAKVIGVETTVINTWADRGLLQFRSHKIGSRKYFNRDGLLSIGIMNELSWLIGPKEASEAAKVIWAAYLAGSPHGLNFKTFIDEVITFQKPLNKHEIEPYIIDAKEQKNFLELNENDWFKIAGFPLFPMTRETLVKDPIPHSTTVTFPIGQLFCSWAFKTQWELEKS